MAPETLGHPFPAAATAGPETVDEPGIGTGEDSGLSGPHIRCPKCGWQPRKSDQWACTCGHTWNTFDTGGVCPNCIQQWKDTQCLQCGAWSPHSDWYTED